MSARAASAVGMVLLWLGCALFLALRGEPVPAWLGTVLCGVIVLQSIVAHVGEQISNATARLKGLNDPQADRLADRLASGLGVQGVRVEHHVGLK